MSRLDQMQQISGEDSEKSYFYTIVSYHRNNSNPKKSKWTISDKEEHTCFLYSMQQAWLFGKYAWGLYIIEKNILQLGISPSSDVLKCAKFINNEDGWHGYPADYVKNIHDKPHATVVKKWYDSDLITKSQMSKIKQGKCCL